MSHIGKLSASLLLVLPLVTGGCVPKKGTASPEDYFPLIQVALAGGETAAMIGRNEAIKAKNFGGCVAAASLITGFDGATQVLAGKIQDMIVIPAVEIDVSECLALRDAVEAGGESVSLSKPRVFVMRVAGHAPEGGSAPPAEEKAAEEKAAEEKAAEEKAAEEKAAEEKAAEEKAAEEKPAEEKAAEEKAAEEKAAEEKAAEDEVPELKGNPGAAALVETLGGITLVAALHYAAKLQTVNCKKGTAALGVLNYVNGMIKPIADEIAEPDGKVSVPAVTIDLSGCAEG